MRLSWPMSPAIEAMLMTRPHFAGIIERFPMNCVSTNTPVRLTFTSLSQPSSGCSSAGAPQVAPALFTRMSIFPRSPRICSAAGPIASRRPISQTKEAALTPAFFRWETACSSSSFLRAVMALLAPISPSASAICSPRPREPPVTSALRPFRLRRSRTFIRGLSSLELQRLVFEKLLQPIDPGLAAVARLLEAAERRVHVEGAAVHVDLAPADAPRHALRARLVLRPHGSGEAVDRVVRDAHRVLLVAVGDDRQHGTENLFLRDGHVVAHFSEHRGTHIVAARRHAFGRLGAAGDELRAFREPLADVAAHALELRLGSERPEPCGFGERIADRESRGHFGGDPGCLRIKSFRNEHSSKRRAGLAGVEVAAVQRALHRLREVRVIEDHRSALAAELQRDPLDALRGNLRDALAGARRAG